MSIFLDVLMPFTILAYAFVGGVFLAFSDFIMRPLSLCQKATGAEAMQTINREVFRWVFMTLFLSLAVVSLLIVLYASTRLSGPGQTLFVLSGLVYLIGSFGVTAVFNVPMNNELARMDLGSTNSEYWTDVYLPRWTFWNTVRTAACGLSSTLSLFGLIRLL